MKYSKLPVGERSPRIWRFRPAFLGVFANKGNVSVFHIDYALAVNQLYLFAGGMVFYYKSVDLIPGDLKSHTIA